MRTYILRERKGAIDIHQAMASVGVPDSIIDTSSLTMQNSGPNAYLSEQYLAPRQHRLLVSGELSEGQMRKISEQGYEIFSRVSI